MTDEQKTEQEKDSETLQGLVIKAITSEETKLSITEKPSLCAVKNEIFDHIIKEYSLTKENIKQITQMDCRHKEKEEWLDVYIIEYNEGKINENYDRMSTKQGLLKEKPKKEFEGTLKLIIKDNYAVFIRSYNKEIESEANEVFKNLKKRGLKELKFNPDKLSYELI